jgi:hypothetical protein
LLNGQEQSQPWLLGQTQNAFVKRQRHTNAFCERRSGRTGHNIYERRVRDLECLETVVSTACFWVAAIATTDADAAVKSATGNGAVAKSTTSAGAAPSMTTSARTSAESTTEESRPFMIVAGASTGQKKAQRRKTLALLPSILKVPV